MLELRNGAAFRMSKVLSALSLASQRGIAAVRAAVSSPLGMTPALSRTLTGGAWLWKVGVEAIVWDRCLGCARLAVQFAIG